MNRRVLILGTGLLAAMSGLAAFILLCRAGERANGPLRHEVYVWQRAWNQPVRDAVALHATNFARIVPLKAEVSWKNKQPQLVRVALDYAAVTNIPQPIGLALRIGPFAGPFGSNDATATYLCDVASSIVSEAETNRIRLSELQIDFDCAESKLDGYRGWVEAIQRRVSPVPVTITALPSWLDNRAFKRLARVATNYVLQVHSLDRPKSADAPFALCDPLKARRAVEMAGRIGVPFRVALPTYGYTLAFQAGGKFIGLSAEGPRPNWPTNAQLREVSSDPLELSALVRDWTASRPAAMSGLIWYRLPTSADRFNWRWPTLGAIVASRVPQEKFRTDTRRVEPGLVEISLVNEGELDISSRLAVEARWSNARLVAGDGLRGFELAEQNGSAARFQTKTNSIRLPAGEILKLGWLRFDRDCEVTCEVKKF